MVQFPWDIPVCPPIKLNLPCGFVGSYTVLYFIQVASPDYEYMGIESMCVEPVLRECFNVVEIDGKESFGFEKCVP